jgi:DNA-binding transcriptional ArsR family regulator
MARPSVEGVPTDQEPTLDRVFHALADPTRRALVERLVRGPASVRQLAEPFQMSLTAVMQHLQVLVDAGLVTSQKSGRVRTCTIEPAVVRRAESWLGLQRTEWEHRLDRLDQVLTGAPPEGVGHD